MILVAIGSNVSGSWGLPVETLDKAVDELNRVGVEVVAHSSWYETEPYGDVEQPPFVNGVLCVKTDKSPVDLLDILQRIEIAAGRVRREKWGPRTLDLDIIAYNDVVLGEGDGEGRLIIPHPDLHNRTFVLIPLQELNENWRHPMTGLDVTTMLAALDDEILASAPKKIVKD